MGEKDLTTAPVVSPQPNAGPAAAPVTSAQVAQVATMLAQGATPGDVAGFLAANPAARDEIMTYLHVGVGNAFVQQVILAGGPTPPDPLVGGPDMLAFPVTVDDQVVQIYVSPGGIDHHPDAFMFFHGYDANYGIDSRIKPEDDDNVSGKDSAAAAMAQAKATNTIAILPQGIRGTGKTGGQMPAMIGAGKGFEPFLDHILQALAMKLAIKGKLEPRHIALAGHSAGGYQGIHEAMSTMGRYADTITDLTLMDSSYSNSHFEDAQNWLFTGSPGKTIRIAQSHDQLLQSHHPVPDPTLANPKQTKDETGPPHWQGYFGDDALVHAAKLHAMTLVQIQKFDYRHWASDDDRGNSTKVMQHTQVINADGKMQCDILVMQSDLGHHEIRDNVMDDAIDSIGKGGADSDRFGKNQIPYYGRDPDAPHAGNAEHVPGEPVREKRKK